ncbi:ArsR/SmtB family transcription factor [Naumannella cuiyingiana]|uniref:Uncharacterized protein n=1 Tax=Naumannella cuiyingiana TaxID=1347891 RepID=A0A7Z0IK10_9ACTN|nr:winged helix-turn-helix domain-containing protein [Naumannella cuiyingiana]NYI70115.1 hypothetical protein [Naumannella cuiyingiana]
MELEDRVAALEKAVAELREAAERAASASPADGTSVPPDERGAETTEHWMVDGLDALGLAGGALGFAGSLRVGDGDPVRWQWVRPAEQVLGADWRVAAGRLDALGNPVRLRILHAVLAGARSTAELGAIDGLGTSGQLHHHLRTLVAAGWLQSLSRGHYEVPVTRIVPLLIAVLAGVE